MAPECSRSISSRIVLALVRGETPAASWITISSSGEAIGYFVQEALIDRLEELEDIEDLKTIRHEPTRPFAEIVAELGLDEDD